MARPSDSPEKGSARQPPNFLVVGRIVRPHGIRGGLVVEQFSKLIQSIRPGMEIFLADTTKPSVVTSFRAHRGRYLLVIEGCEDRDTAEQWRDAEIRLKSGDVESLQEGEYYHWQLLGLRVIREDGEALGEITEILETGANDVFIVRNETGGEVLLPAIESVIRDVDLEQGKVVVYLLPGLLPNNKDE
ncbi:MAG: 16S rRNA processing protein RimM [Anaerolineales bacterium]|nr:16S rRNA processing protein RimM [Anaerolineales bacterium]